MRNKPNTGRAAIATVISGTEIDCQERWRLDVLIEIHRIDVIEAALVRPYPKNLNGLWKMGSVITLLLRKRA